MQIMQKNLNIFTLKTGILLLFWAFFLVIFVSFWLKTRNFQQKSSGNTAKYCPPTPPKNKPLIGRPDRSSNQRLVFWREAT